MQETTLTVEIKVSDDNSHLEIVNPSTTEPICALILMGIFKSMGDFAPDFITFLRHHIAQIENQ